MIQFVADSSVLIRMKANSLAEKSAIVIALFHKLHALRKDLGILNLHPAYESILVDFDPLRTNPKSFIASLEYNIQSARDAEIPKPQQFDVPTWYGGDDGPDLQEVAQLSGLSEEEVIRIHSQSLYTVAFLGFTPGFPYLLGLSEKLIVPRKSVPRLRVEAGSVAIAGFQAGIYPKVSPAGWQVLGRTDLELFNSNRKPASLFNPGDTIQFIPQRTRSPSRVSKSELAETAISPQIRPQVRALTVESAGLYSTLQDLGKSNLAAWGVSKAGAADPVALEVGNLLVGNCEAANAIEMTAQGGVFTFTVDTWIAITGAACEVTLDQLPIALWRSLPVSAGQRLVVKAISKGLRSYLCVHGGLTGTLQPLMDADELYLSDKSNSHPGFRQFTRADLLYDSESALRVTLGAQASWFDEAALSAFFSSVFKVTSEANRLGLRLEGPQVEYSAKMKGKELQSEGVANGSIQVTPNGTAIILFCEQQTTGGYPKIATIIQADLHRLGQLKPEDKISFQLVTLEEAWNLNKTRRQNINAGFKEV